LFNKKEKRFHIYFSFGKTFEKKYDFQKIPVNTEKFLLLEGAKHINRGEELGNLVPGLAGGLGVPCDPKPSIRGGDSRGRCIQARCQAVWLC